MWFIINQYNYIVRVVLHFTRMNLKYISLLTARIHASDCTGITKIMAVMLKDGMANGVCPGLIIFCNMCMKNSQLKMEQSFHANNIPFLFEILVNPNQS